MKTIYLVRHAKSSWDFVELPDDQWPLLEVGKKRTRKVINALLEKKITVPQLIISSHAIRAYETAKLFARALDYSSEQIQISRQVYFGDAEQLFDQFYGLDDSINSVMLVGHNPTLTQFVNLFAGNPIDNLPTSGVVGILFQTDKWTEISFAAAKRSLTIFPKKI